MDFNKYTLMNMSEDETQFLGAYECIHHVCVLEAGVDAQRPPNCLRQ